MLLITIAVAMFALSVILTRRQSSTSQLTEPRSATLTLGVQIICGNCAGDDYLPIKTYLERTGNCAQCGGRSYILASNRSAYRVQYNTEPYQTLRARQTFSVEPLREVA